MPYCAKVSAIVELSVAGMEPNVLHISSEYRLGKKGKYPYALFEYELDYGTLQSKNQTLFVCGKGS